MRTSKQKANQLVDKYFTLTIHFPYVDTEDGFCVGTGNMTFDSAIKCAIIEVYEIIQAIDWHEFETPNKELEYWNEVKSELEQLKQQ